MNEAQLIPDATFKDLIYTKFEKIPVSGEEEDPYTQGNYDVIKQLCATCPEAAQAKKKIDIIIDKCGNPPRGVGIQNLRTCIAETKWKFDVSPEERQAAFKVMIISFIERYFYLICFTMYTLEQGPEGFGKAFTAWMEEKKELRQMASEGKDKLEWSRTVDSAQLEQLKEMMASPDYKVTHCKCANMLIKYVSPSITSKYYIIDISKKCSGKHFQVDPNNLQFRVHHIR